MKMEIISVAVVAVIAAVAIIAIDVIAAGIGSACSQVPFGRIFVKGLWALTAVPAFMLYGGLVERNIFKVRTVEIYSESLPKSFDGYRIVQISDLHLRSFQGREKALERAVRKINESQSDLVCFTGDLVTMESSEIEPFRETLSKITAADGVMSVTGNHDYCLYNPDETVDKDAEAAAVKAAERAMGWHLLDNESVNIARGTDTLSVIGVENISASRQFRSYGNLDKAMRGAAGEYKILLSHDPTHWRQGVLGQKDVNLMLSGHTHAMQLSLFGWCPSRYIFREYRGLYSETTDFGEQFLYVNPGLGETILPTRIGVVPEITLITLRRR